jgi:hypothetical protein
MNRTLVGAMVCIATAGLLCGSRAEAATVVVPMGTDVRLATAQPLSSKTNVKGDLVPLTVTDDVRIGDQVVIPAGTAAVGQISDARAKGAMGMNGRLVIRPLYLQVKGRTIRLAGAEREKGSVAAGAVVGMAVLGPAFTGRSANIPAGTPVLAITERTALLDQ